LLENWREYWRTRNPEPSICRDKGRSRGGLENRWPSHGGSWVRIPPSPLSRVSAQKVSLCRKQPPCRTPAEQGAFRFLTPNPPAQATWPPARRAGAFSAPASLFGGRRSLDQFPHSALQSQMRVVNGSDGTRTRGLRRDRPHRRRRRLTTEDDANGFAMRVSTIPRARRAWRNTDVWATIGPEQRNRGLRRNDPRTRRFQSGRSTPLETSLGRSTY
jgi:hypothetical protein